METVVSKHARDLIQKYASGLFRDATLEFYGIKTAKIKELISVELPVMEVSGGVADYIFLLEDGTYLHLEFQSGYNKTDLTRFAGYDIRLYQRDGRKITTIIIYSADVKKAETELNIGSMVYRPEKIMMCDYDGDTIFAELSSKMKDGSDISDIDMLNLVFLPLMRNTTPRDELAVKSIVLAQEIPDTMKRDACIAAAFAFGKKYLNDDSIKKLKEVLKMSDLLVMIITDEKRDIARKLLKRGISIKAIAEDTGLDINTIKELQSEPNE